GVVVRAVDEVQAALKVGEVTGVDLLAVKRDTDVSRSVGGAVLQRDVVGVGSVEDVAAGVIRVSGSLIDHHVGRVYEPGADVVVVGAVVAGVAGRAIGSGANVQIGGVDRVDAVSGVRCADVAGGLEFAVVDRDVGRSVHVDARPVALVVAHPV